MAVFTIISELPIFALLCSQVILLSSSSLLLFIEENINWPQKMPVVFCFAQYTREHDGPGTVVLGDAWAEKMVACAPRSNVKLLRSTNERVSRYAVPELGGKYTTAPNGCCRVHCTTIKQERRKVRRKKKKRKKKRKKRSTICSHLKWGWWHCPFAFLNFFAPSF